MLKFPPKIHLPIAVWRIDLSDRRQVEEISEGAVSEVKKKKSLVPNLRL